jgi:hypothetical protein
VFEGVLVSASSLELVSFFGLIISHVRSYYNTTILCSHYDHYLSSQLKGAAASAIRLGITRVRVSKQ